MEINKNYNFFKAPEGLVFITGLLIFVSGAVFLLLTKFNKWESLGGMLAAGHFLGKGASIPIGVGFLHSRVLTALIVYLQDIVTFFVVFPLLILLRKKVIKSKLIQDTFDQAEEITTEYKWIKTFGIGGVAFCVLFPFQPLTGPITASIVGMLIALPLRVNMFTVVITSAVSAAMWTLLYGEIFDLTKNLNRDLITAITIGTMIGLYVVLYFMMVKRKAAKNKKI